MRLSCLLWALFVSCGAASTVTGETTTPPAAPWQLHLTSSAGNTVDVTFGADLIITTPGCLPPECGAIPEFPIGTAVSLIGRTSGFTTEFPPCVLGVGTGSGTINGVFYPSLIFYTPNIRTKSTSRLRFNARAGPSARVVSCGIDRNLSYATTEPPIGMLAMLSYGLEPRDIPEIRPYCLSG